MKFWEKILQLFFKKDNLQRFPEEPNKFFPDDKEQLVFMEQNSHQGEGPLLISEEVFPKKCLNCPDHKNYFESEIHRCPDCGEWICGRHYHSHIMKNHKSSEYTISGSESGSASYKFKK